MEKQIYFSNTIELFKGSGENHAVLQEPKHEMKEERDPEQIVWTYGDFTVVLGGKRICKFKGLKIILKATDEIIFMLEFESLIIKAIPEEPFYFTIKIYDHVVQTPPNPYIAEFTVNVPVFLCKQTKQVNESRNIQGIFSNAVMAKISFFVSGYEC